MLSPVTIELTNDLESALSLAATLAADRYIAPNGSPVSPRPVNVDQIGEIIARALNNGESAEDLLGMGMAVASLQRLDPAANCALHAFLKNQIELQKAYLPHTSRARSLEATAEALSIEGVQDKKCAIPVAPQDSDPVRFHLQYFRQEFQGIFERLEIPAMVRRLLIETTIDIPSVLRIAQHFQVTDIELEHNLRMLLPTLAQDLSKLEQYRSPTAVPPKEFTHLLLDALTTPALPDPYLSLAVRTSAITSLRLLQAAQVPLKSIRDLALALYVGAIPQKNCPFDQDNAAQVVAHYRWLQQTAEWQEAAMPTIFSALVDLSAKDLRLALAQELLHSPSHRLQLLARMAITENSTDRGVVERAKGFFRSVVSELAHRIKPSREVGLQ